MHPYRVVVLVGLLFALSACGQTGTTTSAVEPTVTTTVTPTTNAVTTTGAVTTTSEATTTTSAAADAAPPELAGRWETENQGERLILSFTGNDYTVQIPASGVNIAARISVEGNQIRFSGGPNPGEGLYEWTVDGDTLTFTELEPPDQSNVRRGILIGFTFTRLG